MSVFGVVCEFNPFHNGHKYLIDTARSMGADTVVCIMSGNAVQRGEFAICDKYLRAEWAIKGGADIVLELPYPFSGASAEYFSSAAVSIADGLCNTLIFGSECGDIDILNKAAKVCNTKNFKEEFACRINSGEGAARVYVSMLEENGINKLSSNDLLGVAYIRAINNLNSNLKPVTVKRVGAGYSSHFEPGASFQSASALRELALCGRFDEMSDFIPDYVLEDLKKCADNGDLADMKAIEDLLLGYFRLSDDNSFCGIAEVGGGVDRRIISCARESRTIEEFLEKLNTKRYTDAKLRRAILYCLTECMQDDIAEAPQYTILLGANKKGRALLSKNRKTASKITIVTKPADADRKCRQYRLNERLDSIYTLARRNRLSADDFVRKGAYMHDLK